MPRPSTLACTTTDPAGAPAPRPGQSPQAGKRRGNPNLALVPRCGARTRAGCPCRAPSIRGKARCRMHGGRSTGPRTPEGRARLAAARTVHGDYGAEKRAFNRHHVTFMRRGRMNLSAILCCGHLPPEFAARWASFAPELQPPPRPTQGITRAQDRAMLQAETAALAPWKLAVAQARQARRADREARAELRRALSAARARPLAPERAACAAGPASAASSAATAAAQPELHAPIRPVPLQAASGHAPIGTVTLALTEPLAPERAAHGAQGIPTAPRPAAAAKAHAPERAAGEAVPVPVAAPKAAASRRAEPLAPIPRCPAPNAPSQAPGGGTVRRPAEPLAPIPPRPDTYAPSQAPDGSTVQRPAAPHAPERLRCGAIGTAAPARSPTPPEAHAPIRTPPARSGNRTVPAGRAARRWLRQQKLMHQKPPAGGPS